MAENTNGNQEGSTILPSLSAQPIAKGSTNLEEPTLHSENLLRETNDDIPNDCSDTPSEIDDTSNYLHLVPTTSKCNRIMKQPKIMNECSPEETKVVSERKQKQGEAGTKKQIRFNKEKSDFHLTYLRSVAESNNIRKGKFLQQQIHCTYIPRSRNRDIKFKVMRPTQKQSSNVETPGRFFKYVHNSPIFIYNVLNRYPEGIFDVDSNRLEQVESVLNLLYSLISISAGLTTLKIKKCLKC